MEIVYTPCPKYAIKDLTEEEALIIYKALLVVNFPKDVEVPIFNALACALPPESIRNFPYEVSPNTPENIQYVLKGQPR